MSDQDVIKAAVTGAIAATTGAQEDQPTTPIPPKSRDAFAWQQGLTSEEIAKHTYSFRQQKLDSNGNPRGPQIGLPDVFYCVGENPQVNMEEHKRALALRYGPARYFGTLKDPQGKPYQNVPVAVFTITYDAALEYGWTDHTAPATPTAFNTSSQAPARSANTLYAAAEEEKARASAAQEEAKRVEAETRLAETKILADRRLEEIKNRGKRRNPEGDDEEEDSVAVKQLQNDLLAAKQAEAETRAAAKVAEAQTKAAADKERLEAEKKAEIARLEADKAAKLAEGERERERLATTLATKEVEHKAALTHIQSTFETRLVQQQAAADAKFAQQQAATDAKFAELKAMLESTKTQLERKPEPVRESEFSKTLMAIGVAMAPTLPTFIDALVERVKNPPKTDQPNMIEIIKQLQAQVHPPQPTLKDRLQELAALKDLTHDDERPDPDEVFADRIEYMRKMGMDINFGKGGGWVDGAERIIGALDKPLGAIGGLLAARNVNPRLQEQARRRAEAARRGRRIQGPSTPQQLGADGQPAQAPAEGQQPTPAPKAKPPQAESSMSPKTWGNCANAIVQAIDKQTDPVIAAADAIKYWPGICGALASPQVQNIEQAQVSLRTLAGNPKLGSPASEFLMALVSRLDQPAGKAWGQKFLDALKGA